MKFIISQIKQFHLKEFTYPYYHLYIHQSFEKNINSANFSEIKFKNISLDKKKKKQHFRNDYF
jgi:hypothetical protein